jgi:hypothetical protein
MSRSGYTEDYGYEDPLVLGRWRGMVASAIRGKRGQAFLKELLVALDDMPDKRLITEELAAEGDVCTLGALGRKRQLDLARLDPEAYWDVAATFGVASPLVQEIVFMNDEGGHYNESPWARYERMRSWVIENLKDGQ